MQGLLPCRFLPPEARAGSSAAPSPASAPLSWGVGPPGCKRPAEVNGTWNRLTLAQGLSDVLRTRPPFTSQVASLRFASPWFLAAPGSYLPGSVGREHLFLVTSAQVPGFNPLSLTKCPSRDRLPRVGYWKMSKYIYT